MYVTYIHISINFYGFSNSLVWGGSWTIKKAEHQRNDVHRRIEFQRRLLRVHWTARKSNQSVLMEITPEYSLEGLMQHFGHLMQTTGSLEKTVKLG